MQKAFKESAQKYPIYLFFSVNGSGKFMGLAQMVSEVEYRVNFNYWSQNDKWKGFFFIRWIYIKDIPNKIFRNIINEYNDNKPVTSSRDTQEIFPSAGIEMYKIFKEYPQETSIFDQLSMEEKMAIMQSQQQGQINAQIQQQQMRLQQNKIGNINKQQQLQQSQVPGMYNIPQHFQQQQNQNNLRNNLSQNKLNNNNNSNNNNMYMNQLNMQSIDMLNQINMNNKSIGMNPHHNLIGHNGMNNPRINNPMNISMGFGNMNLQSENQLVNQIPLMMQQLQKQQEQFKKMSMVGLNYNNSNNNNPSNTILGNISNNGNE